MTKEEAGKIYLDEMQALRASVQEEQSRILAEYAKHVCNFKQGEELQTPDGKGVMLKGLIDTAKGDELPKIRIAVQIKGIKEPKIYTLEVLQTLNAEEMLNLKIVKK